MPATYEPIATTTLSNNTTQTIQFTSIPNSYTDLRVVLVYTGAAAGYSVNLRLNGDTANNYSTTMLYGTGSAASSFRETSQSNINIGSQAVGGSTTLPGLVTCDIFSYAGSTNKTVLTSCSQDANGSGDVVRAVGLYRSTTAITSLSLIYGLGVTQYFGSGTTATLYGILKA